MTIQEAVKIKMMEKHINQTDMAALGGFKNQSNVSTILKSDKGMRTDNLFAMLDVLGCDLAIIDRASGEIRKVTQR